MTIVRRKTSTRRKRGSSRKALETSGAAAPERAVKRPAKVAANTKKSAARKSAPKKAAVKKAAAKKSSPSRTSLRKQPAGRSRAGGNGRAPQYRAVADKLSSQRAEMLSLFRSDRGVGQDASHEGDDDVDRANFDSNRELALSLSNTEREVLLQITDALDRLKQGSYGSCSHCTEPIAEARLVAIPWARHCVGCQELEEKGLLIE